MPDKRISVAIATASVPKASPLGQRQSWLCKGINAHQLLASAGGVVIQPLRGDHSQTDLL